MEIRRIGDMTVYTRRGLAMDPAPFLDRLSSDESAGAGDTRSARRYNRVDSMPARWRRLVRAASERSIARLLDKHATL